MAAIAVIVGLQFRSAGAPLATLACAGVAYLVAVRVVAWAGQLAGITVPPDLEPVLVVLLLGVTTDYAVFFLAGMRGRPEEGDDEARARRVMAEYPPIIVTAGLIVAAGSAALSAARLARFRSLGPGLALTVLTAMVVAVTLTPRSSLCSAPAVPPAARRVRPGTAGAGRAGGDRPTGGRPDRRGCAAGLLVTAASAAGMRLAVPLIRRCRAARRPSRPGRRGAGLRAGRPAPTRSSSAGRGHAAGRTGATGARHGRPARRGRRGGPADVTAAAARRLPVAGSGNAVRFAVIESTNRSGPPRSAGSGRSARTFRPWPGPGLAGVRFEVGGQTAISADAIDALLADLWRVALAIALVTVVLVAASAVPARPRVPAGGQCAGPAVAFGLTVWIFRKSRDTTTGSTTCRSPRPYCWWRWGPTKRLRGRAHLGRGTPGAPAGRRGYPVPGPRPPSVPPALRRPRLRPARAGAARRVREIAAAIGLGSSSIRSSSGRCRAASSC